MTNTKETLFPPIRMKTYGKNLKNGKDAVAQLSKLMGINANLLCNAIVSNCFATITSLNTVCVVDSCSPHPQLFIFKGST